MKLSEQWLREWVNPPVDTEKLTAQLTMAGLEVDSVKPAARTLEKVVVGEVIAREKHPDADRLSVCRVDVGEDEPLEIVCGAPNVRTGLKVAVVLVGGVVGDLKVKKTKLRGVVSNGMICSEREMGLSEQHEGIMELPADAPIGKNIQEYLTLDDYILDIELTPNRGDCASVRGIAREVGAINRLPIKGPNLVTVSATINDVFPVEVKAEKACPRYIGRVIRGVDSHSQTPLWICERLRRSGLRTIHPVVDVMNYVMLELGQPLHAFDLSRLVEGIEVRFAKADEKITLIDETEIALTERMLVIADKSRPQALAGIMGGANSAVNEKTEAIFLESAYFSPGEIALTARHYDMQTDSSYRFERGVDFKLQTLAMERATELLIQITGGSPGPLIEVCSETHLPKIPRIILRPERIKRLLGIEINEDEVSKLLELLGMRVVKEKNNWVVTVPSHRFDIKEEADLIEELAHLYGYDRIPQLRMEGEYTIAPFSETQLSSARLRCLMTDRGYHEAVTYSFVNDELQTLLNPEVTSIALSNPLTAEMNVMRTSLWPGLIQVLKYNQARQTHRIRLFEIGMCFNAAGNEWQQVTKLGGLVAGDAHSLQWAEKGRRVDFYDVKGDLSALFTLTRTEAHFRFAEGHHPALHPGQSAALYYKDQCIGYLGALHPELVDQLELTAAPFLFEMELNAIKTSILPKYHPLSKFPSIRRDIAIVVDRDVPVGNIEEEIKSTAGQLLIITQVFDIYESGKHIEFGKKSVALGLTFQDPSRTLIDGEVKQIIERVLAALERKFNAKLRA
ncbi:phenylalanine--tRNA ligase subunit beta [Coxiella burnetii]|uniref:Phenylalanine--tRNA ligase beta subunit n=2 Tax=Coxiella burnetii TaxID=777 RepID=SYFB_COXBU|nr:phenylalanine--tRNA ligase subunit beta [Coxiella burnetii]NP_820311.1 phenylalanine--tRNA ligase subunit beta [Coxiella burnetii RSA 493]Q83C15.1 RecName: Full=Phenylalanine--tRNA ligase beta subunit; AltName: Full=Phenylalanyl-tRNA synthetase beta subunit; Short=PheRS [Coxiella burnetii RSA 493]AAO90825.1 phenylalanyl-tRNA synthetase beta chain [Coxiella burnetii RSA 493]ABS76700.1 phenylalanyl-tRNA synthetase beta chain [Coxiella burnetii Dugway 5J108-111]ACJ18089.1 phenylalanyl-tRNA syn